MIQRIQSVFLLIAGLSFIGTTFFRNVLANEAVPWLLSVVVGLNLLAGGIAIVTIFLYKDRKKQLRVASMLQYVALVAIVSVFGAMYLTGNLGDTTADPGAMAIIGLPILGYILIRLSGARIRKDIELIRSMDRLR